MNTNFDENFEFNLEVKVVLREFILQVTGRIFTQFDGQKCADRWLKLRPN